MIDFLKRSDTVKSICYRFCPTDWYEAWWPTSRALDNLIDAQAEYLAQLTGVNADAIKAMEIGIAAAACFYAYRHFKSLSTPTIEVPAATPVQAPTPVPKDLGEVPPVPAKPAVTPVQEPPAVPVTPAQEVARFQEVLAVLQEPPAAPVQEVLSEHEILMKRLVKQGAMRVM